MAEKETHRFSHRPSRTKTIESITTLFFRLATYCVILAAGYIFVDIIHNGSKAVFTTMLGAVLFGRVGLQPLGWLGIAVNTLGGVLYSVAKYREAGGARSGER